MTNCEADICMAGCYGDYMLYIPGGRARDWTFFRGIGRRAGGPFNAPFVNPENASIRVRRGNTR